ncbi:hypothetical protein ACJX0J_039185, partial [Zea mays]
MSYFTGCGCLPKQSVMIYSTKFAKPQAGPVDFAGRPLVFGRSDKRAILMHANIEEIEAEKSLIEDQAVCYKRKDGEGNRNVQANFNTVRTGRANPAMLDRIEVEYYGTPVNLKSIAQISTPDVTSLLIQPYDKSSCSRIFANSGIYSVSGTIIRGTLKTPDRSMRIIKDGVKARIVTDRERMQPRDLKVITDNDVGEEVNRHKTKDISTIKDEAITDKGIREKMKALESQ